MRGVEGCYGGGLVIWLKMFGLHIMKACGMVVGGRGFQGMGD